MKISHEVPLCFLKESLKWNDYQYILPHLIDQYPQYKIHMLEYRQKPDSFIICDNGLFEGIIHTTEDLLEKINLIRPNVFIVPDAWNDATTTLVNAKSWMLNYKKLLPEGVELMAVCQGESLGELITTYQSLVDMGYTHIAFNHSSCAYMEMYPTHAGSAPLKAQMYGRMEFIRKLVESETIRKDIYHHLLGASDWREFQAYTEYDFIKSVDTSSPIINGALGIKFNYDGNYIKPKQKLEDIMELNLAFRLL
jgi:hypothetical protein